MTISVICGSDNLLDFITFLLYNHTLLTIKNMEIQSQNSGNDIMFISEIEKAIADAITSFRDDIGSVPLNHMEFGMPKDKSIAPSEPFSESEAA
jgi:chitinase